MSVLATAATVLSTVKIEEEPLVAPSVIFPIIALSFFTLLAAVTWSYRDVANRHRAKSGTPHGPSH